MSEKHDGWVIKNLMWRNPFYLMWTFSTTRKEAIQEIEENWNTNYSARRRNGELLAVKVKLVEVV